MRTHTKSFVFLLGIGLAVAWTAACGTGSVSDSISSPDVPTGSATATVQGTVSAGSGSGSSAFGFGAAAASQPVRVSVLGSNQATTTDRQGRFTLGGVPTGSVTLRFQASGVDARLDLGGLVEGQVLTINVQVSGSSAKLVSDRDDHEFTGTVESVTPPVLLVSGVSVLTNDATEVKRDDLRIAVADIQVGETAKVEGQQQADGSVLAREIKVSGGVGQGSQVEFTGTVESVTPPSLVVSGRSVLTDSNTEFKGQGHIESVADLSVGDVVEVEGFESTDGSVLALEIKRLDAADDDDEDEDEDEDDDDDDEDGEDDDDEDDDDDNSGSGS